MFAVLTSAPAAIAMTLIIATSLNGFSIEASLIIVFASVFSLLGYYIDEYRISCWQFRRARDIGRSSFSIMNKRWPMWVLFGMIPTMLFAFFALKPDDLLSDGLSASGEYFVFFGIPAAVIIAALALGEYELRVIKPFNAYLFTTPGDPGPNQYGPPPTS